MIMKKIVYYQVNYEGSTDLGNVMSKKCFEKMEDAIAYLESNFPKFLEYHKHYTILHEYKHEWYLAYTHQFVLVDENGHCIIILLRVERMHLTLN